jgi:tetratricopeptide (TPR) repeat protein
VTGLVLFAMGLGCYLNACGAADALKLRAASRGCVLQSQMEGELQMVMLRLEEALKAWPQNRMAQAMKANLLSSRGKPEDAEEYLNALAGTDAPPPAVFIYLANLHERRSEWPKAAAALLKFAERIGPDGLLYSQAAQQCARARDFRSAEELLARAASAEPPDLNMLMARAAVHAAARRVPEVIADLKAVIARREVHPGYLFALIEKSPDFAGVREDPAFKAFAAGAGGGAPRAPAPKPVPAPAPEGAPKGGE